MKKSYFMAILVLFIWSTASSQKWVNVWSDEFNKPGLPDSTKWNYEIGLIRNNELQYYTYKRIENAHIDDTALVIEARKESFQGADYTSASIITQYIGDWQYGKMEIRAKIPTGKGTWPAIWMMPTDNKYGSWPKSGEIDIMENVGFQPNEIFTTVHYYGTDGTGHQSSGDQHTISKPFDKFITYAVEWNADKIDWFIDTQKVFTYNRNNSTDNRIWPFNQKFYLILNLAIGGSWGGQQGVDNSIFPTKLYIDYVRIYQWQDKPGPYKVTINEAEGGMASIDNPQNDYPEGTKINLHAIPNSGYKFKHWLNMSSANPFELEVNKDYTIVPVFEKIGEVIKNGNFNDGLNYWNNHYIFDKNTQEAKSTVVDGLYIIDVSKSGTDWWHIGDQQLNLPIDNNANYQLTFDAYSDNPAEMGISLSKNHSDYGSYFTEMFDLTASTTTYTWNFTMNKPTDLNCRLFFGVGNFSGNVYLDNISLIKNPGSSATEQLISKASVSIFPNPANQQINIELWLNESSDASFELLDYSGKLIVQFEPKFYQSGSNNFSLPIQRVSDGVYFIRVKTKSEIISKKIIIN